MERRKYIDYGDFCRMLEEANNSLRIDCEWEVIALAWDNGCYPYSEIRCYNAEGDYQLVRIWYDADLQAIIAISPID